MLRADLAGEALRDPSVVRLNRAVRLPAARAELLARVGRVDDALAAYDAALAACGNEAERAHLERRRAEL